MSKGCVPPWSSLTSSVQDPDVKAVTAKSPAGPVTNGGVTATINAQPPVAES